MYTEMLVEHNYKFQLYFQKLAASLLLFSFLSTFLLFGDCLRFSHKEEREHEHSAHTLHHLSLLYLCYYVLLYLSTYSYKVLLRFVR